MAATPEQKIISVRLTPAIEHQIQEVAHRDAASISTTMRRLMMLGLRTEKRAMASDNEAA